MAVPIRSGAAVDEPDEVARYTRFTEHADGSRVAESWLQVSGITCTACSGIIEAALARVTGVIEARVSAASQRAVVRWDCSRTVPSAMISAIEAAGYGAAPDVAAPARELRRREQRNALWRLFVAALCSMQVMMLATPSYVATPGDLSDDMRSLLNWGQWVLSVPVLAFAAGPFLGGAWKALRQRRIGMDVPVALGLVVAFVASTGATFDPQGLFGREVYFDSLTMFVAFLLAARWFELRVRHRAAESLEVAVAAMPQTAIRRSPEGAWEEVSIHRLQVGDVVRCVVGAAFPADALLIDGVTQANESLLSGESAPVDKRTGDELVAGSINLGAPVDARVLRAGRDTRHAAIIAMMRDAASSKPDLARLADRWAGPFLWGVLALAALSAGWWSVNDPSRTVWVAVAVLVVTCPCALSLAAPATLVAAAGGLARRGVLVRRLEAIEAMSRVTHAFFDKTGTLTEDRLRAVPRVAQGAAPPRQAIVEAARLASHSGHLASKAIIALADADADPGANAEADASIRQSDRWREVREHPGRGLEAIDADGRVCRLGSASFAVPGIADDGGVWFSRGGEPLLAFDLVEILRPDAARTIAGLHERGVATTLLSGDSLDRAQGIAQAVGIADVVTAATPAEKLRRVETAQAAGATVLMVGDGVNDAPVLAKADVGLAMGQGALVAQSTADAVIASNQPFDLLRARDVSVRAMRIVRQNLGWAAAYNFSCVPLAAIGWLPPWAAGLGMALSSLLVVTNASRAGRPVRGV